MTKHVTVILSLALVAVLYAADKLELQRKIKMRANLEYISQIYMETSSAAKAINQGGGQLNFLNALLHFDGELYNEHIRFRKELGKLSDEYGSHLALGKFTDDETFSSFHLEPGPPGLITDIWTSREYDGFTVAEASRVAEFIIDSTAYLFIPTQDVSIIRDTILSKAASIYEFNSHFLINHAEFADEIGSDETDEDTGSRNGTQPTEVVAIPDPSIRDEFKTATQPFILERLDVDSAELCVNRTTRNQIAQVSSQSICLFTVPLEGVWRNILWGTLLGLQVDTIHKFLDNPQTEVAIRMYGSLNVDEAVDLLSREIASTYGDLDLLGVSVPVHFLSPIMALILIASAVLVRWTRSSQQDERDQDVIPLLLSHNVIRICILILLPIMSVFVAIPHYPISALHSATILIMTALYVIFVWPEVICVHRQLRLYSK